MPLLTTSWQRFSCTVTTANHSGPFQIFLQNQASHTLYLWGAQVEIRSSVGTYVQTTSAQISGSGVYAPSFTSTVATGTPPLSVASTTPVANLSIGGNAATATALAATPGGAIGQAVCWKAAGVLGYCSSVVGVGGDCTCN